MAKNKLVAHAIDWLNSKSKYIWPKLNSGGRFDWSTLFDPKMQKAPIELTPKCTGRILILQAAASHHQPAPRSGDWQQTLPVLNNLYLAGAWIDTGFNTECIEAAVISGMQAARAVSEASFAILGEDFLRFGQGLPSLIALAAEGATLLLEVVTGAVRTGSGTETDRRSSATRFTSSESRP